MKKKKIKLKISMNIAAICVFTLALLAVFLSFWEISELRTSMDQQIEGGNRQRNCQRLSRDLADASDYLTEQTWYFAATHDVIYMENYWNDVENVRSREKTVEQLEEQGLNAEEVKLVRQALEESSRLVEKEAWVFRMISESIGLKQSEMPKSVASVQLTLEEQALTPDRKQEYAVRYIFGKEYIKSKQVIKGFINEFGARLNERERQDLLKAEKAREKSLHMTVFYSFTILFSLLITVVLFYFLAIRPFRIYAAAIQKFGNKVYEPLVPIGSLETRKFAVTFNEIYKNWQEQNYRLEEERFRFHVAIEGAAVIIYEYDIEKDFYRAFGTLELKDEADEECCLERQIPGFMASHLEEVVSDESMALFLDIIKGTKPVSVEVKVRRSRVQEYVWANLTAKPIFDEHGKAVKLIGKISNIQKEKEKEFALLDAKSRDALTGLYNREAGIAMVQAYMAAKPAGERCCMMLLDMDDFKEINEKEGVVFADAILQEVADIIRAHGAEDDILVRLGGDEFMLFIKQCDRSRGKLIGEKIADGIKNLTFQDDKRVSISASIGMCMTDVVDEYSGVYRCAESTLKYAKEKQKGKAACYLDTSNELGMLLTQLYPDTHFINTIDVPNQSREDVASFALDLLGKSKNLDDAVFLLMSRIGHLCRLDRFSIIEIDQEYLTFHFKYQWVANKADSQTGETYYITKDELKCVSAAYNAEGLCEEYIIKNISDMKSILHTGIWNHGAYEGTMSFETWEANRTWSAQDRKILNELSKIISSFILKAKSDAVSQAKTDFLSRMSHEIRTPMNVITGMTQIAKNVLEDTEKARECLGKIESANTYLLSVVNDILDMSRIESGKVEIHTEPVNVRQLMNELRNMMELKADAENLELVTEPLIKGSGIYQLDRLRLNQILINLLGNAIKFTPSGGTIWLKVEQIPQTNHKGEDYLRFSVADTGIGITREAKKRIFTAFEQANNNTASTYGGTGLGLTISSKLVQLMGGTLEVDSQVGSGSEFYFTIKAERAEEEKPDAFNATADSSNEGQENLSYDPHGKRLLLAEDNELNQEIATTLLKSYGYQVDAAWDGREAVELFRKHEPHYYDAVLMDIRMPVMDGMEALKHIRTMEKEDSRTVPVIAMTADVFDEDMKKSLDNGMNGYITKPIEVESMLQILMECIKQSQNNSKK